MAKRPRGREIALATLAPWRFKVRWARARARGKAGELGLPFVPHLCDNTARTR